MPCFLNLPHSLRAPLRPQPASDTLSPVPPPGLRWFADRGAIPGEPTYFLDGDSENARAVITPLEVPRGGLLFDAVLADGTLVGTYDDLKIAAAALEYVTRELL